MSTQNYSAPQSQTAVTPHSEGTHLPLAPERGLPALPVQPVDTYDTDEWCTPEKYLELARLCMGGIDCDPASNDKAQQLVRATVYYTKANSGLVQPWIGNVWLNPPYSVKLIQQFVIKLILEIQAERCTQAVVLVNNATETGWYKTLCNYLIPANTRARISFRHPARASTQNRQGQTLFYYGPDYLRFYRIFDPVAYPPMALIRAIKGS